MSDQGADPLRVGLAAGREEAFAALYDRYAERLYRAALTLLGEPADAEDAVQETFMAMVRSRKRLARVHNLTAYLFAALRHAAARCAERRRRRPIAAHDAVQGAPAGDSPARADPRCERLQRALSALPAEQRDVLALKVDGGLTFAEIGEALAVSANTAASRYRYALGKLRAALEE